jgi:hypothetical protein
MTVKRHNPPTPDDQGLAQHGASADEGVVLRAQSKGPGVPVEIENPRTAPPRRVVGGAADFSWQDGRLYVTPTTTEPGKDFTLTVEY